MIKKMLIVAIACLAGGCATITIQPVAINKIASPPTHQESRAFFLWGLVGEQRIDVKSACGDRQLLQMQSQQTFLDGLLTGITLGLYSPHSVKVWCD